MTTIVNRYDIGNKITNNERQKITLNNYKQLVDICMKENFLGRGFLSRKTNRGERTPYSQVIWCYSVRYFLFDQISEVE